MTRPAWTRGKAVVGGELRYVSPSQIVAFDPASYGGCPRRWYYRSVEGKPEPEYEAQEIGTEGHAQIEEYLRTGKMVLGQHALAAKRFLPDPDPKHLLELSIDDGTLTAAGLPVVGFIDFLHGSRRVLLDHGEVWDPDRSVEVVDWKFTGRKDFPTPREVAEAVPMVTYGEWTARKTGAEWIRLSHVYISTRRREASKRSVLVRREDLIPRWERAEGVVRRMQAAAQCKTADEVDANLDACSAYRGCPHRAYCTAGKRKTLVDLLGPVAADQLLAPKEETMSLLDIPAFRNLKQPDPVAEAKAKLLAEEAAAKAPPVDPALAAAVRSIEESGHGRPTLAGDAAEAWAAVTGQKFSSGDGTLAVVTLQDPADLVRLAEELKTVPAPEQAAAPPPAAPPATGLLPPDAPPSDPVKALAAIEGPKEAPAAQVGESANGMTGAPSAPLPDVTPAAAVAPPPAAPTTFASADLKLSKKAREYVEKLEARIAELEGQAAMHASAPVAVEWPAPAGLQVFVDCIPPEAFTDLAPWVHDLAKRLADQYQAADIRCASNDTPLGFGKWKGALAAVVREAPIDDGVYFLDTRGSEILEVAAEALRSRARVTRGIR